MGTGRYLDINDLVIDKEFEELLPVLSCEELEKLEESILKYGLLDPIKIWQDPYTNKWIIIDGHNRYNILKKNNIKWNCWNDYKMLNESELETREDVKRWMLEQQLGRRNLSEAERYEIVQKFKSLFERRGKENQSSGGKGLSNLSKVNTRKEMAKATGMSEGTYQKLDKVMKSDNEKVKEQLRKKEISIDKAYKAYKNHAPNKTESITPEQQIGKIDIRMDEIDKQISDLKNERESLARRRRTLFWGLDIQCPIKYRFCNTLNRSPVLWKCTFYIEHDGKEEILCEDYCYMKEEPYEYSIKDLPEKYRNDFMMVWNIAKNELEKKLDEYENTMKVENEKIENALKDIQELYDFTKLDKAEYYLKKFQKDLMKIYHPDNKNTGDNEAMQYLNKLKELWGI